MKWPPGFRAPRAAPRRPHQRIFTDAESQLLELVVNNVPKYQWAKPFLERPRFMPLTYLERSGRWFRRAAQQLGIACAIVLWAASVPSFAQDNTYRQVAIGEPGPLSHSLKPGDRLEFLAVLQVFANVPGHGPVAVLPFASTSGPLVRFDLDHLSADDLAKLLAACPTEKIECFSQWRATFKGVEADVLNVFWLDGFGKVIGTP